MKTCYKNVLKDTKENQQIHIKIISKNNNENIKNLSRMNALLKQTHKGIKCLCLVLLNRVVVVFHK